MMNRRWLMFTSLLMSAVGVGGVWAQCATDDCATLGYTEAYNSSGNCLKCPFGEAYNCEAGYICPDEYNQECNDDGEVGVGERCNGKYSKCSCKEGYNLVDGGCQYPWGQCSGSAANCKIGDILFSDGTCAANMVSNKTPIAVVLYISDEGCGQAMTLNAIGNYQWATVQVDIADLPNRNTALSASKDFSSCENTKIIMAAGDKSLYPAAWAAHEYKTKGTNAGNWCLPAAGIITSYYNNQNIVNNGFSLAGSSEFIGLQRVWTSSETSAVYVRDSFFEAEYGLASDGKSYSYVVRPVIEF